MAAKSLKEDARNKLWKLGHLSFKLHSGQAELYNLYYNSPETVQTWLIARRHGKSFCLCLLAIEQCIRKPNSIVKFLSPTRLQVKSIVLPLIRKIIEDCPEDIRPDFIARDYCYKFPNGSEIQLAGTDNGHAEKLRGGDSHLNIIDEAGSCNDLENTVRSVLIPTTMMTKGKLILVGTPPTEPDHDFVKFIEESEIKGTLIKKTIYENPQLTKQEIEEEFEKMGGTHSDQARRELLCEIIRDPKTTVVPEFTKELREEIVKDWPRPPHYDMYEGMDLGFKDLTVNLLGYYDFRHNKVVIEDEVIIDFKIPNTTIETLIKAIETKEELRFFNHLTNEQKIPTKRVSDINHIVTNEISIKSNYKMIFQTVKKDNLDAMVNFLREKIKKREIIIHPRCETLIRHLTNVKWKKGIKDEFARSPDDGHYDAVAALIYLIRCIDYRKNPYPAHWGRTQQDAFGNYIMDKPKKTAQTQMDAYRTIFNIKKKG